MWEQSLGTISISRKCILERKKQHFYYKGVLAVNYYRLLISYKAYITLVGIIINQLRIKSE